MIESEISFVNINSAFFSSKLTIHLLTSGIEDNTFLTRLTHPSHFIPSIKIITKKPIVASEQELKQNSRSASAKLRIAEKI